MRDNALTEKVISYLQDTHALEHLSLRMLDSMIRTTKDPYMLRMLQEHRQQTVTHERRVNDRLQAMGTQRSMVADAGSMMTSWFKGMGDQVRGDKPGKNARDGYVIEQVEIAAYELLERLAVRAGDTETAGLARQIKQDEYGMARHIAESWDRAIDLTLAEAGIEQDAIGAPTGAYGARADAAEKGETWTGASVEADMGVAPHGDREKTETLFDQVQGRVPNPGETPQMRPDEAADEGGLTRARPDAPDAPVIIEAEMYRDDTVAGSDSADDFGDTPMSEHENEKDQNNERNTENEPNLSARRGDDRRGEDAGPSVDPNEEEGSSATRPGTRSDTVSGQVDTTQGSGIPTRPESPDAQR